MAQPKPANSGTNSKSHNETNPSSHGETDTQRIEINRQLEQIQIRTDNEEIRKTAERIMLQELPKLCETCRKERAKNNKK